MKQELNKKCTKCGEDKPVDQYSKLAGNRTQCYSCYMEKKRAWFKANPDKVKASIRAYNSKPEAREKKRHAFKKWAAIHRPKKQKNEQRVVRIRFCDCGQQLNKGRKICDNCREKRVLQYKMKERARYIQNKNLILNRSNNLKSEQRKTLHDQYILKKLRDFGIPRNLSSRYPEIIELKRKQLTLKRLSDYGKRSNANG